MHMLQRENEPQLSKFWKETYPQASLWKPCAHKKNSQGIYTVSF